MGSRMRGRLSLIPLLGFLVLGLSCAPVEDRRKGPNLVISDKDKEPAPPPIELPKEMKTRIEATLKHVHSRDLETTHSFWTIFHGILGMGFQTTVLDRKTGERINAIQHIRSGKNLPGKDHVFRGLKFLTSKDGVDVRLGPVPEGQGHQDQFIAEMAQWGMKATDTFTIDGKEYTFLDFARLSKARASVKGLDIISYPTGEKAIIKGQELGWAILVIAQYYGVDTPPWTNRDGDLISLEDLLRAELKIDMSKAACGGTHSLFGLTWVYFLHLQKGGKVEGVWADIDAHLKKYRDLAKKYQNPDGAFSTQYVNEPEDIKDPDRRINTTGHTLEWLALYLTDEELREPWVQESVMALCKMVLDRSHTAIDTGSLYHATHGLHIYYDRVFGTPNQPGQTVIPLRPK